MTRIMRDSTVLTDIPVAGTQIVAAYVNGQYAASAAALAARFPGMPVAWIDVNGSDPHADILDVEKGDAAPATAVPWCRARRAAVPAGYPPVIYCDRSTLTPLFNAMGAAGLQVVRDFRLWIATLDGTKAVPDMTGVSAVQYAGQNLTGGHYDESIVYDDNWKSANPSLPAWITEAIGHAEAVVALLKAAAGGQSAGS
jgi:hypothetical protein